MRDWEEGMTDRPLSDPEPPATFHTPSPLARRRLVPWKRDSYQNSRAGHPASRRCSSLKYAQYSRSSRLAIRAPRPGLLLGITIPGD